MFYKHILFSSDPSFYYANAKTQAFRHGTTIFISTNFPLINNKFMMNFYKVFSYPVPITVCVFKFAEANFLRKGPLWGSIQIFALF
jgi:hypothetical protein